MKDKICYLCNKPARTMMEGIPLCLSCSKKEEPDFFLDERRSSIRVKQEPYFSNEEQETWR